MACLYFTFIGYWNAKIVFYINWLILISLPMGNAGVWTPYMIIGGAVVELIVFLMLSVYSYCRHRVG